MKIGILGTGAVGNTIGSKLIQLGHEVKMGSRKKGNEKAIAWVNKEGGKASEGSFEDAASFGELIFNCTGGIVSIEALTQAGEKNLKDKIIIDLSNALDFSKGRPPRLAVCNDDSIGEQIQQAFPNSKVVKTLNTVTCTVMVNPALVPGDHDIFVSGNDEGAKTKVTELLKSFGWTTIVDLGDITTARGTEMLLPLWVRLYGKFQTANFNFKIVK